MKKFFKNLVAWLGWMWYKFKMSFTVISLILGIYWVILIIQNGITGISHALYLLIMIIYSIFLYSFIIVGLYHCELDKNWRVAVAEAEKMAEDPEEKYAFAHHTLWSYIQSTRLNKSGKDLCRITQLLQKHHELNAQLLSFEQERNKLDVEHDKVLNERNGIARELSTLFS